MRTSIPNYMQAVLLESNEGLLRVGRIPVPIPGPGQVLIRMAAAPINPSDLGFLEGSHRLQRPFSIVPGLEGSGIVVSAGSGLLPHLLMGKRVACSAKSGGTWAEYLVTSATSCFPLPKNLSLEQGAMMIVNPMTALVFFDIAKRDKHAAIVSNAAASALGRMILRLGQLYNIPVIHVVRRQEQVDLLHAMGGQYVLNGSDPNFYDQLHICAGKLNATLILDPVGGDQIHRLLDAAPNGSTSIVYGHLSGERLEITSQPSSYNGKHIVDFYLPDWIAKRNIIQVLMVVKRVIQLATNELHTTIQKRFPLQSIQQAIRLSQSNPIAGKVLLVADPETVHLDMET